MILRAFFLCVALVSCSRADGEETLFRDEYQEEFFVADCKKAAIELPGVTHVQASSYCRCVVRHLKEVSARGGKNLPMEEALGLLKKTGLIESCQEHAWAARGSEAVAPRSQLGRGLLGVRPGMSVLEVLRIRPAVREADDQLFDLVQWGDRKYFAKYALNPSDRTVILVELSRETDELGFAESRADLELLFGELTESSDPSMFRERALRVEGGYQLVHAFEILDGGRKKREYIFLARSYD